MLACLAQLDANNDDDDDDNDDDDDASDKDEEITHSVPFKCIGAAHEQNYQHHLELAYLALKQNTPVKVHLRAEPLNPLDPSAIAIDLDYGTGWCHVGYIASELCKYLHPLMVAGNIIDVCIQHIKYRVDFLKVGFYPKIWIKRRGEWETEVVRKSKSVR